MNPHAVLGVRPGASRDEVRAAWRRTARATHPDHGGDPGAFAAAADAYERLGEAVPGRAVVVVIHLGFGGLARRWLRRRFARGARRPSRVA